MARVRHGALAALVAVCLVVWAAAVAVVPAQSQAATIVEYLQADERFTVLMELLQEADLVDRLNRTGGEQFTLFAPTNAAINGTGMRLAGQWDLNNATARGYNLTEVLLYHVVPAPLSRANYTATVPPGDGLPSNTTGGGGGGGGGRPTSHPTQHPTPTPTQGCVCTCPTSAPASRRATSGSAAGSDSASQEVDENKDNLTSIAAPTLLELQTLDGHAQRLKVLGLGEIGPVTADDNVTVIEPDIQVANGFIQIIDGVLLPPGNVTVATTELPLDFSLWVALVERLNLTDELGEANATVFLPIELATDDGDMDADDTAGSGSSSSMAAQLIQRYNDTEWRAILGLHLVPNAVLYTADLAAMLTSGNSSAQTFDTAGGAPLNISVGP